MKEEGITIINLNKKRKTLLNLILQLTIFFFKFSLILNKEKYKKTLNISTNGIVDEITIIDNNDNIRKHYNQTDIVSHKVSNNNIKFEKYFHNFNKDYNNNKFVKYNDNVNNINNNAEFDTYNDNVNNIDDNGKIDKFNDKDNINFNNIISDKYNFNDNNNDNDINFIQQNIDTQSGDQVIINIFNDDKPTLYAGVSLQIGDRSNLDMLPFDDINCDRRINLFINNTLINPIPYCHLENSNFSSINFSIPTINDDCYISCKECNETGDEINHNCTECDNDKGYYPKKDDDNINNCYNEITIGEGYYLNENEFKKCHIRCLTCDGEGTETNTNCLSCDNSNNFHFDPNVEKHCIIFTELPNDNYYLDNSDDKYKLCNQACDTCDGPSARNCKKCNNQNDFHFHPNTTKYCVRKEELEPYYFLDEEIDKFVRCHISCLSCFGSYNNECIKCQTGYYKVEDFVNQCLSKSEIPENYYYKENAQENEYDYKRCHISCRKCRDGGRNDCTKCNIDGGYYSIENYENGTCFIKDQIPPDYYIDTKLNMIRKCYKNCSSCEKGFDGTTKEMNCDTCIIGTYFQNTSSTNCIPRPKTGFYIDKNINKNNLETLYPCYSTCSTCDSGGNITINNCSSCAGELYFDDEINTTCVEDDPNCGSGCAKCNLKQRIDGNKIDKIDIGRKLDEPPIKCKRCSFKKHYYPLKNFFIDGIYLACYHENKSPKNFYFEKKFHRLCYKTCAYCYTAGNFYNHSCKVCDTDYTFIDEEPFNCYPKCVHNYYYTKYKQYKCTDDDTCPQEYPNFISEKRKCVDNCYDDDTYKFTFEHKCFKNCPEGSNATFYRLNGKITNECIEAISNDFEVNKCITNSTPKVDKITEEIIKNISYEYVRKFPIVNNHVVKYTYNTNTKEQIYITLFKSEKCLAEKPGLNDCMEKVKNTYNIKRNILIVSILPRSPTNNKYYLYHPISGKELDFSICSGKIIIKSSIFDNKDIDKELVLYFFEKNINVFDEFDPFFTDICLTFSKEGKDVPLDTRLELFFQNVSLCEEGCSCVDIDLDTYEVKCSCEIRTDTKSEKMAIPNDLLNNPLSNEYLKIITDSNLEVLKCLKKALDMNLIMNNYGGLTMFGIYFIQIISSFFIKVQFKQFRSHIFNLMNKYNNPPPKKVTNKDKTNFIIEDIDDKNKSDTSLSGTHKTIKLEHRVDTLGEKKKKKFINKLEIFNKDVVEDNFRIEDKESDHKIIVLANNKKEQMDFLKKSKLEGYDISMNKLGDVKNGDFLKIRDLQILGEKMEDQIKDKMQKIKNRLKNSVKFEYKDYNEKELNELDYEDAILYDKRTFCQMYCAILKQKQIIINTFCGKSPYQPFSIKLLVMLFSFSCYFVINGFLYNEDYVGEIFKKEVNKDISIDLVSSTIERIVYASLFGGIISMIIGILFNTEKEIEKLIKRKKNDPIILKGEITKIYKFNVIKVIIFVIFQFCAMAFFTLYILCFCYVYPNTALDWTQTSLIVVGIIQSMSFFTSLLIALLKFIGIKRQLKLCFLFNEFLDEKL